MRHKRSSLWVMAVMMIMTTVTQTGSSNRIKVDIAMSDKKVLDELLNKTHYDKRLRPPAKPDGVAGEGGLKSTDPSSKCINATVVSANVVVLSLTSPDESSLKYDLEFLMHQHWQDSRLTFEDLFPYEFLNGIHHQDDIWIPDTYFVKHGDFKQIQLPSNIALRIFRDGSVKYTIRRLLSLDCEGDLNIFPFDGPKCSFAMESVSYERDEMEYKWKESDIPPLYFLPNMHILNAYIISNETRDRCEDRLPWRGNYSCLKVHLVFTRDKSFYFSTVFIPGMLLVTSSFITFWLEWNAVPGRVMLGVTTMLNFFTTSNNFRSNLPVVSNLTAMNVWDGVCMCFIYASLLEFVAVNYLGRKKPRGLRCYRTVSTTIAVCQDFFAPPRQHSQNDISKASDTKQNIKGEQVGNHENYVCNTCPPHQCIHAEKISLQPNSQDTPKVSFFDIAHPLRVAKTIDVVSRVVFPVAYGVFLIFFFARYNGFS